MKKYIPLLYFPIVMGMFMLSFPSAVFGLPAYTNAEDGSCLFDSDCQDEPFCVGDHVYAGECQDGYCVSVFQEDCGSWKICRDGECVGFFDVCERLLDACQEGAQTAQECIDLYNECVGNNFETDQPENSQDNLHQDNAAVVSQDGFLIINTAEGTQKIPFDEASLTVSGDLIVSNTAEANSPLPSSIEECHETTTELQNMFQGIVHSMGPASAEDAESANTYLEMLFGRKAQSNGDNVNCEEWGQNECEETGCGACHLACRFLQHEHTYEQCMHGGDFLCFHIDGCLDTLRDGCTECCQLGVEINAVPDVTECPDGSEIQQKCQDLGQCNGQGELGSCPQFPGYQENHPICKCYDVGCFPPDQRPEWCGDQPDPTGCEEEGAQQNPGSHIEDCEIIINQI